MTIKLYTQVALTVDLPQYGLKNGDVAYTIHNYPMPDGTEDGYSLEGFGIPIDGITVEVTENQIRSLTTQELEEIQHRSLSA